jgi:outer membrane protein insertion porin family
LINPDIIHVGQYEHPEYHKWRFNARMACPHWRATGEDKNRQFVLKMAAKFGFMDDTQRRFFSIERFQLGDAGLTNNYGLFRIRDHFPKIIPGIRKLIRILTDQSSANRFFYHF